ncbi:hypothetical protein DSM106972_047870 [Dulcicalothrix desertica PCC 7102]|uniref:Uncharacterized protein n=2 Tax=Dulcicalothrix desertica TaxID=32056 RepID=A0A3S1ALF5_9CYAN|nr:hypothetical protein DSM106972_047870 [Dulcicalothrix desertica PCC 7102]
MAKLTKSLKSVTKQPLTLASLPWLLLVVSLTIMVPSLVVITSKSCGEGELTIKLWEFEYNLIKTSNCGASLEQPLP